MRPENLFLKRIKELQGTAEQYCGLSANTQDKYWPFYDSYEALEKDCFKREDGIWQLNYKINTHIKGGSTVLFIWRIAPNYCCHGQPLYTEDKIQEFLKQSETEKVLLIHKDYEFVWTWNEFHRPTRNIWGLKKGPDYLVLRKNGEILVKTQVKKHFLETVHRILTS